MNNGNFFLVIEGLDGSGKTELSIRLNHLLSITLGENARLTFEPHDPSCAGLFIRQVLMKKIRKVSDKTLALAFAANRLDHCDREISPFLNSGNNRLLICDRYYLSSLTYQTTNDIPIEEVYLYNMEARRPDLTIFLNASNQTCFERMKRREEDKELFERNLNRTRRNYETAIRFLREKDGQKIVEVSADGNVDDVLNKIVKVLGREGPNWLRIQPILSTKLLPKVFTLNDHRELTINELAIKFQDIWNQGQISSARDLNDSIMLLRDEIIKQVEKMSYNLLGSLFIDFLEKLGYKVGDKLSWSDLDAFELEYSMPGNLTQRGVAMLLGEAQRYDLILKKASTIEELSDFLFVFQPSKPNGNDYYYERDLVKYADGSSSLSPAIRLLGKEELTSAILSEALRLYYEEHFNTLRAKPDLLSVFREHMPETVI